MVFARKPSAARPPRAAPFGWRGAPAVLAAFAREAAGTALVNFAMIAPILIVMLLAIFDYGVGFYDTMALQNAVRAGAQYGTANPNDTAGIIAVATNAAEFDPDDLTVAATRTCGCADGTAIACGSTPSCGDGSVKRSFVNVSMSKPHTPILPFTFGPSVSTLSADASLRVE